jgi:hypothetical protein
VTERTSRRVSRGAFAGECTRERTRAERSSQSPPAGPSCWHSRAPVMLRQRLGAQQSELALHAWNSGKHAGTSPTFDFPSDVCGASRVPSVPLSLRTLLDGGELQPATPSKSAHTRLGVLDPIRALRVNNAIVGPPPPGPTVHAAVDVQSDFRDSWSRTARTPTRRRRIQRRRVSVQGSPSRASQTARSG